MGYDIFAVLQEKEPTFSKGQKRIACYITEEYDKAAFMTANRLGKTVGVSESTVVRFAVDLGFDGYPSMLTIALNAPTMKRIIKCGEYYVGFGNSTSTYVADDIMGPWSSISLNSNTCDYIWAQDEWLYWISYSNNNVLCIRRGKIYKASTYYQIQNETVVKSVTLTGSNNSNWDVIHSTIVIDNTVYVLISYYQGSGSYGSYVYNKISVNTINNTFSSQTSIATYFNTTAVLAGGSWWYTAVLTSNTNLMITYFDVVTNTSNTINKDLAMAFDVPITYAQLWFTYAYSKFTACLAFKTDGGITFAYAHRNNIADFENIADVFTVQSPIALWQCRCHRGS